MKILIPLLGFGRAGGNRVLASFANEWIREGHSVDFLAHETSMLPYFPTDAPIKWTTSLGSVTDKQGSTKGIGPLNSVPAKLFGLYLALNKIGNNYDIILANHSLTAWPVAFASCKKAKKSYYCQAYEPEYYALEPGLKARVLGWISTQSYNLGIPQICNAPVYIDYKNMRAQKWVPPGIDFNLFQPSTEIKDLDEAQEIILGCIGRREPAKGIRYVLEAFETLWAQDPRYKLHVAFGNLPDNWNHPGLTIVVPSNDKELSDFYRSIDIMIAPGTVQLGAPHYPVMEAFACGIPTVTTGYLPANQENAWIVPIGDVNSIVESVKDIVQNTEKREAKKVACLKDISGFEWSLAAKKMLHIFQEKLPGTQ